MSSNSVIRASGFIVYKGIFKWNEPKFLLLQSARDTSNWAPPKGHVDPGENDYEAAMRELYEETGITENLMDVHKKFCKTLKYNTPKGPKECIYYLALVDDTAKVKLSSEHIDFKWLTISEIAEAHIYPDLHHMLEEGYNFIKHSRTLPMFPIKGCIYSA